MGCNFRLAQFQVHRIPPFSILYRIEWVVTSPRLLHEARAGAFSILYRIEWVVTR